MELLIFNFPCLMFMTNLSPIMLIKFLLFFLTVLLIFCYSLKYLCICQQPDNSDLFKGHSRHLLRRGHMNWVTVVGGLAQVGDKAQRWGGGAQKCEDTMSKCKQCFFVVWILQFSIFPKSSLTSTHPPTKIDPL